MSYKINFLKLENLTNLDTFNRKTIFGCYSETINQGSLPTQLLPRCVDGNLEEARMDHFKTGAGEVVLVKTPNTVYEATYTGGRTASVTVNACGFAQINSTSITRFR